MNREKAAEKIQDYIHEHIEDNDFNINNACSAAGYSRRHGDRLFKEFFGKTLQAYVNAVCLTQSAKERPERKLILSIVVDTFSTRILYLCGFL